MLSSFTAAYMARTTSLCTSPSSKAVGGGCRGQKMVEGAPRRPIAAAVRERQHLAARGNKPWGFNWSAVAPTPNSTGTPWFGNVFWFKRLRRRTRLLASHGRFLGG